MRLSSIIKFSIDGIMRKAFKSLVIVVLFSFSFVLIAMCIIPNILINYIRSSVNDVLIGGVERTAIIEIKELQDGCYEFIDAISSVDGVKTSGAMRESGMDILAVKELYDIQQSRPMGRSIYGDDAFNSEAIYEVIRFDRDAWEIFDFELAEGSYSANSDPNDKYVGHLYLGSAYADISVGTEYQINEIYKLRVMGILKEGARCTTSDLGEYGYSDSKIVALDHLGIIVNNYAEKGYQSQNLFVIEEDADMQWVVNEIHKLADVYGIGVSVRTVESIFEEEQRLYGRISDMLMELMIIVIIVATMVQACVQIVDIIGHFQMYGVMYANGATQCDIALIVVIENIIRYILSCSIGYGVTRILFMELFSDANVLQLVNDIYHSQVLVSVFLIGGAVSVISVVVPILLIRKKLPVELVNNI